MAAADLTHLELHRFNRKVQGAVDHSFTYDFPGWAGDGVNIGIIDTNFMPHEDLPQIDLVAGEANAQVESDHGTTVAGIIAAKHNLSGYLGIAPNVTLVGAIGRADRTLETHKNIRTLANILNPGDIIVTTQQRAGPLYAAGQGELGSRGMLPNEWWEEEFQAIRYATQERGIIVVSCAGNGDSDLTAAALDTPYSGAPAYWTNPFKRAGSRDSGSILVGAASPGQPRTINWGVLGSRLGYSNYGPCVDVSSWGREVTVLKYYRDGTNAPGSWYYTFGAGTSVSTPIVAACLASVQGALKAAGLPLLTPASARAMLRATGLPQTSGAYPNSQRIGPMVNLRDMYEYVGVAARPIQPPTLPEPVPEIITNPFLTINGVRIPLELGSARRVNNRDKTERALSGAPLTSRFKTKESFSFKTVPLTMQESLAVNGLFLGQGEGCDYKQGDLYTAKGLGEMSGATFASRHWYHNGQFLNAGIHPVYRVGVLDSMTSGTFYVAITSADDSDAMPLGTVAMFYGNNPSQDLVNFVPNSEIQITSTSIVFHVLTRSNNELATMELPRSLLRPDFVNTLAFSYGPGGPTTFAVNGELAFNNMYNPFFRPYAPYVALGERWGHNGRGTWTDGTRPLNWKIGQWGVWPFQVSADDVVRMSNNRSATHGSPAPYIKAGGLMISNDYDKSIICEGRVAGIEYQQADQVVLNLEMDEI